MWMVLVLQVFSVQSVTLLCVFPSSAAQVHRCGVGVSEPVYETDSWLVGLLALCHSLRLSTQNCLPPLPFHLLVKLQ